MEPQLVPGRNHEPARLFSAGVLWAAVAAAVFAHAHPAWLPLTLLASLFLAAGMWPVWRPAGSRVAWILAYGLPFVWTWSHGQPGSRLSDAAYWAGLGAMAALALWSARAGSRPTGWCAALVALGVLVAFFSGPSGGADPWLRFFQETLRLPAELAQSALFWSRKSTHFFGYGAFAYVAFREARAQGLDSRAAALAALLWIAPHAVFDEADQLFAGNRNASAADVLVDWAGAAACVLPFARRRR